MSPATGRDGTVQEDQRDVTEATSQHRRIGTNVYWHGGDESEIAYVVMTSGGVLGVGDPLFHWQEKKTR